MAESLIVQVVRLVRFSMEILMADNAPATIEIKSCLPDLLPVRMLLNVFLIINQCSIR